MPTLHRACRLLGVMPIAMHAEPARNRVTSKVPWHIAPRQSWVDDTTTHGNRLFLGTVCPNDARVLQWGDAAGAFGARRLRRHILLGAGTRSAFP